ncbi:hypothetical protein C349_06585 [Cryptococcus neoformans var. grubii Br795]|nr:hypothetical protein C349_06585 [Cryptococcus neoformans var. grubii Br795]
MQEAVGQSKDSDRRWIL